MKRPNRPFGASRVMSITTPRIEHCPLHPDGQSVRLTTPAEWYQEHGDHETVKVGPTTLHCINCASWLELEE